MAPSELQPRSVSGAKILGYLLAPWRRQGGPKARFFMAHGFSRDAAEVFRLALLAHPDTGVVRDVRTTPWGVSCAVDGPLRTPRGTSPIVRTAWFRESSGLVFELVSAYPAA
jgi:hypothetical protein